MCLSVLCFRISNNTLNRWMRPFQGQTIILTHQRTILAGEITRISHGAKITMTTHGQIMQATSIMPIILPIINPTFSISIIILPTIHLTFQTINRTFPTKLHNPPSRILNKKGEWLTLRETWKDTWRTKILSCKLCRARGSNEPISHSTEWETKGYLA